METLEQVHHRFHGFHVQGIPHPPDITFPESGSFTGKKVQITSALRMVTGVKVCLRLFQAQDIDIRRQFVVPFLQGGTEGQFFRDLQVSHLSQRVGAAGPLNVRLAVQDAPGRFDQGALDTAGVRLALPAAVTRSVVFDDHFIPGHVFKIPLHPIQFSHIGHILQFSDGRSLLPTR